MEARLIELLEGGKKKRKVSAHAKEIGRLRRAGYSMAEAQKHIKAKGLIGGDFIDDEFDEPAKTKLKKDNAKYTRKQIINQLEVAQAENRQLALEKDRILGPALVEEKRKKALATLKRVLKKIEMDEHLTDTQKDEMSERSAKKYKDAIALVKINSIASFDLDPPTYTVNKAKVLERDREIEKLKALMGIEGVGRKKKARK